MPHGAFYSIEEEPVDGFTITDSRGLSGIIIADETTQASFENTYSASGQALIIAKKELLGADIEANTFAFELKDESGSVLQVVYANEQGGIIFDPIYYNENDVGRTFMYYISEVNGEEPVYYDSNIIPVKVTVRDSSGTGTLSTRIVYSSGKVFTNTAMLPVTITNWAPVDPEKEFVYTVVVDNCDLIALNYETDDGSVGSIMLHEGVCTFILKHTEGITFTNLPYGCHFTVTQTEYSDYWTMVNKEDSYVGDADPLLTPMRYDYENYKNADMPQTGSTNAFAFVLIGIAICFIGLFLLSGYSKKEAKKGASKC